MAKQLRKLIMIGAASMLVGTSGPATAYPVYSFKSESATERQSRWVETDKSSLAPQAFIEFCRQNRSDCLGDKQVSIKWDPTTIRKFNYINRYFNRVITPVDDANDTWRITTSRGDCEDYALTKRAALIRSGVPAGALRIAVVLTEDGVGHAVLVVNTVRGDFVLDNLTNAVLPWHATNLDWKKISGVENPRLWKTVS